MTVPATAEGFTGHLPTGEERAVADQLRQIIAESAAANGGAARLDLRDGIGEARQVALSPRLSEVLLTLLRHITSGKAVTLVPMGEMLTTQQAADILNVSRPYLVKLLEGGDIPHEKVNRHRRVRADDLFAYKRERDGNRAAALGDLAAADAGNL